MLPIKGSAPSPKAPYVTLSLIAVNVAVFLFEVSVPVEQLQEIVNRFGFVPARFWAAIESPYVGVSAIVSPFVTSMFMHGGWGHLAGNMLFLWVFGDGVENRIGRARFFGFYILVGVLATLTHAFFSPGSTLPTVGASGAIAGVLGAYLLLYPTSRVLMVIPIFFWPFFFEVPAVLFLLVWFAEQFFFGAMTAAARLTTETGGVAWWAHIGGFVFGAIFVAMASRDREMPEIRQETRFYDEALGDGEPQKGEREK
jgi:membrane associated rhomboid family serine protease